MCSRRSVAPTMSVPTSARGRGRSADPRVRSPPIPEVRLMTTSTSALRTRSTTSVYRATSREPIPVIGSRTWMWTMAAPAFAAAMHSVAICSGVTGTLSLLSTVLPLPVTAQVMKTELMCVPPRGGWIERGPEDATSRRRGPCSNRGGDGDLRCRRGRVRAGRDGCRSRPEHRG